MKDQGRCIAVDLIGMGKSDLPKIDYCFTDGYACLEAFIDSMKLKNITLVIHDWGAILGFHYANLHRDNIKAIAFMDAAIQPVNFDGMDKSVRRGVKMMKNPIMGPLMVKRANIFIKKMIPMLVKRELTKEEKAFYAAPYKTVRSRKVLLKWPQSLPMNGKPKHVHEAMLSYAKWLKENDLPKLCIYVLPGAGLQEADRKIVEQEYKNTILVNLGEGEHFMQEDFPHEIAQALQDWYNKVLSKK